MPPRKNPGLWDPPPMSVRHAAEALGAITFADLQKMQSHQLVELTHLYRTAAELVALELKRRAQLSPRRDNSRRWYVEEDDRNSGIGFDFVGTRP